MCLRIDFQLQSPLKSQATFEKRTAFSKHHSAVPGASRWQGEKPQGSISDRRAVLDCVWDELQEDALLPTMWGWRCGGPSAQAGLAPGAPFQGRLPPAGAGPGPWHRQGPASRERLGPGQQAGGEKRRLLPSERGW